MAVVFDQKENIVKMERREVNLAELTKGNLYFSSFLPLNPGDYKCRLAIRNLESGRSVVASSSVLIPEVHTGRLQLSAPLLLKKEKEGLYVHVSRTPAGSLFDPCQYAPLLEELDKGSNSFLVTVQCFCVGMANSEIRLLANLLKSQPDTTISLPVSISILDRKRGQDAEILLLRIQI